MMCEGDVITLCVMHGAPHAVVALAEAQVIGGVILGGFALTPVPVSTLLNIYYIKGMILHDGPVILQSQIVYT